MSELPVANPAEWRNTLEAARWYIANGYSPVPVPPQQKKPVLKGWQKLRLTGEQVAEYFKPNGNLGLILGGDGLADLDFDCLEAGSLAAVYAPETGMVTGRASNPRSHYWYYTSPPSASEQYRDPSNNQMVLEIRSLNKDSSTGHQTIVPPSIHTSGEPYLFYKLGSPASVEPDVLTKAANTIAGGAVLARHWPEKGARHRCELALAGVLCRAGWTVADAEKFVVETYYAVASHDPQAIPRVHASVRDTFKQKEAGGEVTGLPTLIECIGNERVVKSAVAWLGLRGTYQTRAQNHDREHNKQPPADEETKRCAIPVQFEFLVAKLRKDPDISVVYGSMKTLAKLSDADLEVVYQELKGILGKKLNQARFFGAIKEARVAEQQSTKAAQETSRALEPNHQYRETTIGIIRLKQTKDGAEEVVPLTNFWAKVTADVVEDDGAEVKRFFEIEARLMERQYSFIVPADRFDSMEWAIANIGPNAVVNPNQKDWARAAVQCLSDKVQDRRIYTHTGWRKISDTFLYLHGGGAIGAGGAVANIDVRLSGALAQYNLLLPAPEQLIENIQASLRVIDVAEDRVSFPLLASVYRSCVKSCDFAGWLGGPTGVFKSELAALAQQHYGLAMNARRLPANFASTGNALEMLSFGAKDALLVVDDFAPFGGAQDIARYHASADRILRAAGNNQGRGRLSSDARLREVKPPRGLILATGEDMPRGQSIRGRTFMIEVGPGDVRIDILTECQVAAGEGRYAGSMAAFIHWIAGDYVRFQAAFTARVLELRSQATKAHFRTPGIVADLYAGFNAFLDFAESVHAIEATRKKALADRCWSALNSVAKAQVIQQEASEPAHRFLVLLRAAILSGEAHVAGMNGGAPGGDGQWGWRLVGSGENERMMSTGKCIGWLERTALYLEPTASYGVAQELGRRTGEPLVVGEIVLRKRLKEKALLASQDVTRGTLTVRRTILGNLIPVLHLQADAFACEKPVPKEKADHLRC